MTCNELHCANLSCALCFDCQQSLCLNHIIVHHDTLIERHLSFYEILQELYHKLHSMSIEQCYHRVFEQLADNDSHTSDVIRRLRAIREELIEQLNRFKQKQFHRLQSISLRLSDMKKTMETNEANDLRRTLEETEASINSLVYGIHLEMSNTTKTVQCEKIFHQKTQPTVDVKTDSLLQKSVSWTKGTTDAFRKNTNESDERLSLF